MPNDKTMNLRMSDALLRRIDRHRGTLPIPPTRPEFIRQILDQHVMPDPAPPTLAKRKVGKAT